MTHRVLPVRTRERPAAITRMYPPWCWIHERRLVYKRGLWVCPEIEHDGMRCHIACTDEQARGHLDEFL